VTEAPLKTRTLYNPPVVLFPASTFFGGGGGGGGGRGDGSRPALTKTKKRLVSGRKPLNNIPPSASFFQLTCSLTYVIAFFCVPQRGEFKSTVYFSLKQVHVESL
jgi:hypothetical protein